MRLAIIVLAVSSAMMAIPALAEPPVEVPPTDARTGALALFISPAGEPFRAPFMEDGLHAWFSQADANGDGALSPAEFTADHDRVFRILDIKGDGQIDGPDVRRYEDERVPEINRAGDLPEARRLPELDSRGKPRSGAMLHLGKPPTPREGAARFSLLNEIQPIRTADADVDFRVSLAEWDDAAARRFKRLDVDGDGRLSPKEMVLPPRPYYARLPSASDCPWYYCDYYFVPYHSPYGSPQR